VLLNSEPSKALDLGAVLATLAVVDPAGLHPYDLAFSAQTHLARRAQDRRHKRQGDAEPVELHRDSGKKAIFLLPAPQEFGFSSVKILPFFSRRQDKRIESLCVTYGVGGPS